MAKRDSLPPFPYESAMLLEKLTAGVTRRRPAPIPSAGQIPPLIIVDRGDAQRKNRYCVARALLTKDGVPVYQHESSADTLDDAIESICPTEGEIEVED